MRKFYLFKIGILTSIISSCSKISEEKSRAEKVEKELTDKIENLEKRNQEWSKTEQAFNDALKDANSERKQLEQKVQQLLNNLIHINSLLILIFRVCGILSGIIE